MRKPHCPIELAYDREDFTHRPRWCCTATISACNGIGLDAIRLPFTEEVYFLSSNSQL